MPTSASYTLVALLIAPALIRSFGLADLPVHFFVFYSAILSGLSPPIAVVAVVAAGVAEADFIGTCIESLKISFPLFVLPIAIVYNPEIIMNAMSVQALTSTLILLAGALFISYGANATTIYSRKLFTYIDTLWFSRLGYVAGGSFVMIYPGTTIRLVVLGILSLAFLTRYHNLVLDSSPV